MTGNNPAASSWSGPVMMRRADRRNAVAAHLIIMSRWDCTRVDLLHRPCQRVSPLPTTSSTLMTNNAAGVPLRCGPGPRFGCRRCRPSLVAPPAASSVWPTPTVPVTGSQRPGQRHGRAHRQQPFLQPQLAGSRPHRSRGWTNRAAAPDRSTAVCVQGRWTRRRPGRAPSPPARGSNTVCATCLRARSSAERR